MNLKPIIVDDLGDHVSSLEPRGWENSPKKAVVIPLQAEVGSLIPTGVLVLGVNPRTVYDDVYETFFRLLAHQTAIGLLSVTVRFFLNFSIK
jgi:hypothetical protein